ncbi:MAG TPA: GNAT family N-acetyltransferase [Terriglobales bacterium]|jgi:CelD/BcsL family acetyltransferase involved in cellulose biosynthesis
MAIVRGRAELMGLREEWDKLLDRMPRASPFLSWDWIQAWWEEFGPGTQMYVITARRALGELVGVAPLHVVRRWICGVVRIRRLEFIGYRGSGVCADHLDFLAPPEEREVVARALAATAWQHRSEWDEWDLADLAEDSSVPEAWAAAGGELGQVREAGEVCYYLPLPATVDELWDQLRQRHPRTVANLGRDRRRLERRHRVRLSAVKGAGEVAATMAALAELHGAAQARRGGAGNFHRPGYRRFHQRLVARLQGRETLYLARMDCGPRPVAVLYGYCRGGVLYFYQSGFDTAMASDGVGRLLLAWVLEDAVERLQAHEFDFLRGPEQYKTLWAPAARHTQRWRGWRANAAGRLARLDWRARRQLAPWRARLRGRRVEGAR